jgi:hypothetical protein
MRRLRVVADAVKRRVDEGTASNRPPYIDSPETMCSAARVQDRCERKAEVERVVTRSTGYLVEVTNPLRVALANAAEPTDLEVVHALRVLPNRYRA